MPDETRCLTLFPILTGSFSPLNKFGSYLLSKSFQFLKATHATVCETHRNVGIFLSLKGIPVWESSTHILPCVLHIYKTSNKTTPVISNPYLNIEHLLRAQLSFKSFTCMSLITRHTGLDKPEFPFIVKELRLRFAKSFVRPAKKWQSQELDSGNSVLKSTLICCFVIMPRSMNYIN